MKASFDVCHVVIECARYEWTQDNELKLLRKSRLMPSYVEIHMYPDLHLHLCRNKHHLAVGTAARRSVLEHSPRKRKVEFSNPCRDRKKGSDSSTPNAHQ